MIASIFLKRNVAARATIIWSRLQVKPGKCMYVDMMEATKLELSKQRRAERARLAWRQAGGRQPTDGIPLFRYDTRYMLFRIRSFESHYSTSRHYHDYLVF